MTDSICRRTDDRGLVSRVLAEAERLCLDRGTRLTALRRRVLEIIWSCPTPIGAYAILDVLRDDGRQGAPPTVYRALDFLLEQGLIHRLASLNAYIGCCHPAEIHGSQFLICNDCGKVSEMHSRAVEQAIRDEVAACGFQAQSQMVEVLGRCADCRHGEAGRG